MAEYFTVDNLKVYQLFYDLHIEVWRATKNWPRDERFELTGQINRSSNSASANLAEKHNDRHFRNRIEGVNRARGEAMETVHHLFMARRKGYLTEEDYLSFRERYGECVKMLIGLEKHYERQLDSESQRAHPK